MRLTTEQIDSISRLILSRLKSSELAEFKVDEELVFQKIVGVITANLREEDALDHEVEDMIESHVGEAEDVDRRKMFSMVKSKLVRERDLII